MTASRCIRLLPSSTRIGWLAALLVCGIELVRRSPSLADSMAVVGAHHEEFDGSGYPKRIHGAEIPITARIFAVVDVFEALIAPAVQGAFDVR